MIKYFSQSYTCESGAIGKIIIPENASEDDLRVFKEFLDMVIRERLRKIKKAYGDEQSNNGTGD